ncbi:MAG: protein kinase, partial [Pirellulaceae bacterium]|nr:protein kinase [Pirellulaceae bacterium]
MPARTPPNTNDPQFADMSAACEELLRLIKLGESRAAEVVFQLFPDLATHRDAQLELIYLEFVLRHETNQPISGESLCQRFPELAAYIRMLMEVDSAVHWSRSPAISDSTLSNSPTDTPRSLAPLAKDRTSRATPEDKLGNSSFLTVDTGFDDYEILEKIGQGGMGLVYRALQRSLNRLVAIKTINIAASFHPTLRARFQAEAELSAQLQHPNIVQIYSIGENDGVPYFSMELVAGPNLAEAIAERPLEPQVAARLVATLARAIHHAHTQGVIHRDLKPTNILLAPSDQRESGGDLCTQFEPKIADFGLARFSKATTQQTYSGAMLGTPSYMAPEQITDQDQVGPVSDVYSLGAILYTLLVGRPPFHAASALETLRQVRQEDPTPLRRLNSRLPRDLETICLKCLRKEPQARYESAEQLSADLHRFLLNKPIAARPIGLVERTWKWTHRHPSLATLILALVCSSVSMTALWWRATASQLAEGQQRSRAEQLSADREMQHAQREYEASNIDGCKQLLDACDPAFRHWEWHYLNDLCDQALWQSPRYAQAAQTTDISRDGRYVAIGYGRWGYDAPQEIHLWDLHEQRLKFTMKGHPNCSVHDVHFSPDGKHLISAAIAWNTQEDQEYGGVILWNLETGKPRFRFPKMNALVANFHQDGQSFFLGSNQGSVTQHSVADGKLMKAYRGEKRNQLSQMILDINFDFNAQRMAATSRGGELAIWNLDTPKPIYFLNELGDPRQVKLLPDSQHVMVGGYLGDREWFELGGEQLRSLHRDSVGAVPYTIFSPDGRLQVTSTFGKGVDIRDAVSGKLLRQLHCHLGHVRDMAFDGSGTRLVTCGHDGRAMLWDATGSDHYPTRYAMPGRVGAMVWSPTETEFALIVQENPGRGSRSLGDPRIELRHPATLKSIGTLKLASVPTCLEYARDGQSLLVGLSDHSAQVWQKNAKKPTCSFTGHAAKILDISTLAGSGNAISIDAVGKICQWKTVDGQPLEQQSSIGPISLADFHPHKPLVATTTGENRLQLWNYQTRKTVTTLPNMTRIRHLSFSDDGTMFGVAFEDLSSGEYRPTINLFKASDLVSGQPCKPFSQLTGHLASISGFSFSPDNQRVVTISDDETVRLFDTALGCEVHLLNTEKGNDGVVLFGRDGQHILRSRSNELASWGNNWTSQKLREQSTEERAAELSKWHQTQCALAARQQQWQSARFHATELIALGNQQYLYRRSAYNTFDNRWEEAEKDLQSYLDESDGIQARCMWARIKLQLNKTEDYIQQCQLLCEKLEHAATTDEDVNSIAWTVCLSPDFQAPYDRLTQLLNKAIDRQKKPTFHNTLALVHYRAGTYDEAIKAANQSLKLNQ